MKTKCQPKINQNQQEIEIIEVLFAFIKQCFPPKEKRIINIIYM